MTDVPHGQLYLRKEPFIGAELELWGQTFPLKSWFFHFTAE